MLVQNKKDMLELKAAIPTFGVLTILVIMGVGFWLFIMRDI